MAVTFTVEGASVIGSQRQIWGTLAVTSTGGAFTTGLGYVNSCNISSISNLLSFFPSTDINWI